jgi:hypothetical protein
VGHQVKLKASGKLPEAFLVVHEQLALGQNSKVNNRWAMLFQQLLVNELTKVMKNYIIQPISKPIYRSITYIQANIRIIQNWLPSLPHYLLR